MKRLILTGSNGANLMKSGRADAVVFFLMFRFIWGELPTQQMLESYLADGSDLQDSEEHWSDHIRGSLRDEDCESLSLAEFCAGYDEIEFWFDPHPSDQVLLVWLLDYFRSYSYLSSKLMIRLIDIEFITAEDAFLAKGIVPRAAVGEAELDTASECWQAFRAETPEAFDRMWRWTPTLIKPSGRGACRAAR